MKPAYLNESAGNEASLNWLEVWQKRKPGTQPSDRVPGKRFKSNCNGDHFGSSAGTHFFAITAMKSVKSRMAAHVLNLNVFILHEPAKDPAGARLTAAAHRMPKNRFVAIKHLPIHPQQRLSGAKLTGEIAGRAAAIESSMMVISSFKTRPPGLTPEPLRRSQIGIRLGQRTPELRP